MTADLEELPLGDVGEVEAERYLYAASFYDYVRDSWPQVESAPFVDNWHIGAITEHLQAVTRGQIQNLLINVPPGCSKSLLVCVFWPTWEWTLDPAVRWFFASYDQQLATRDSVKCRALVDGHWYESRWPGKVRFKRNQDQKTYYETVSGGYRLATSIGGHGTGEHPDRIVFDDPHNVRKAESEAERQNVIDWWDLTMPTRGLSRGARRVGVMQRLNNRDLSGHWLASDPSVVHLCLPMRYEPGRMATTPLGFSDPRTAEGELLAPRQFPEDVVARLEKTLGPYGTAGQLQQRPQPRGGGLFKPHYFNSRVRAAPREAVRVRAWDRASTMDGGCYTAGVLLAKATVGGDVKFFVEDVVHGQWEPTERNARIVATAKKDRARYGPRHEPSIYVEMERGSTGLEAFQRLAAQLAGHRVREDRPTGSKDVRAEPWSDQLAAGNVYLVDGGQSEGAGAPAWDVQDYVDEHLAFKPDATAKRLGKFKDQVDASSMAFNLLQSAAAPPPEIRLVPFRAGEKLTHPRLVVCPKHLLTDLHADQRSLLVLFNDPGEAPALPGHALLNLAEHQHLAFADLDPADHQHSWEAPVAPWGKPAAELIASRELLKPLWRFLLKQRSPAPEVWVFADGGDRRAESAARAVCEVLRVPKNTVHDCRPDSPWRADGAAPNAHIFECVKAARGLVVG